MVRLALCVSLREHLRKEEVKRRAGVECISEVIRSARMIWYGHVVKSDGEHHISIPSREPSEVIRSRAIQKMIRRCGVEAAVRRMGAEEIDAMDGVMRILDEICA